MSDNLVTICKYNLPYEAHLARGLLEARGIESYIADEFTVGMNRHLTQALGGVRLQVREGDYKKASEILNSKPAAEEQEDTNTDDKKTAAEPVCPKCGSNDISFRKFSLIPSFIISFLIFLPFPFHGRRYQCNSCRHSWKNRK